MLEGQRTSFRVRDWYQEHHTIPFLPFVIEWIRMNTLAIRYQLHLQKLPADLSPHQVLQAYFDHLDEVVRQTPWAWQGWHWFSGLAICPVAPHS